MSDYFRSMFTSGNFKESTQSEIELKGVGSNGLSHVIEIIYASQCSASSSSSSSSSSYSSSSCSLTCLDLFETIATASHLQCFQVIEHCVRQLLGKLELSNFNQFLALARTYSLAGLHSHVDAFIAQNLASPATATCSSFLCSLSYEQLDRCLSGTGNQAAAMPIREIDLFRVVWKWLYLNLFPSCSKKKPLTRFDLNKRYKKSNSVRKIEIIRSLLAKIRFSLIKPCDLVTHVQTCNLVMLSDKRLRTMVLNALNYHLAPNLSLKHEQMRDPVQTLLLIGGREINPSKFSLAHTRFRF